MCTGRCSGTANSMKAGRKKLKLLWASQIGLASSTLCPALSGSLLLQVGSNKKTDAQVDRKFSPRTIQFSSQFLSF